MREYQPQSTILAFLEAGSVTGPAKNLAAFAEYARALGAGRTVPRIVVATFCRPGLPAPADLEAAFTTAGIALISITERGRFDHRVLQEASRAADRVGADIVQSHGVKSHAIIRASGLWRQRPWVAFHHGYTYQDLRMRLYNELDRWSLPAAHAVVTTAEAFVPILVRRGVHRARLQVVHNAVEPVTPAAPGMRGDARRLGRQALHLCPHDRVVMTIGRLSREKGQADLIRAVALLRQDRAHRTLVALVAGDGPDLAALQRLAARLGVGDAVRFLGHVAAASQLYCVADVAAVPSHTEGSPNALLEAAACGMPIVATAVGGIPEILAAEQTGLLVPARAPDLLAGAIARLLHDQQLARRLGEAARAMTVRRHHPIERTLALLDMYARLRVPSRERVPTLQSIDAKGIT